MLLFLAPCQLGMESPGKRQKTAEEEEEEEEWWVPPEVLAMTVAWVDGKSLFALRELSWRLEEAVDECLPFMLKRTTCHEVVLRIILKDEKIVRRVAVYELEYLVINSEFLVYAVARRRDRAMLKCLRDIGCTTDIRSLYNAVRTNDLTFVEFLHELGCPLDSTATWHAARCGNLKMLQYLRENGCPWEAGACRASWRLADVEYMHSGAPETWPCASNRCDWSRRYKKQ